MQLLWAGFMAILAAGVGFGIRGGIFDNWGTEFGFTGAQLGAIGGAGFTGFCFGIIIGGFVADKLGYGKLVVAAFALHILSAVVTFMPGAEMGADTVYKFLFWGMFIFAGANGVLEAVANPLVATLFPEKRTHYLNILHASWPAGLVLGGLCGWFLDDLFKWHWKYQLALYLIPTVAYGFMFFGQKFPKSEASEKGLGLGEMFKDVGVLGALVVAYLLVLFFSTNLGFDKTSSWIIGATLVVGAGIMTRQQTEIPIQSWMLLLMCTLVAIFVQIGFDLPHLGTLVLVGALLLAMGVTMKWAIGAFLLFFLFITHALVGAVELGTDGWIQNITGNILSSSEGKWLFVITSMVMFGLRFCAGWIEDKLGLSPIGILLVSAIAACVGLNMASGMATFAGAVVALLVYGIGKTFFWPTMLAVASDRYPRTGAIAISIMGGIGMLSAGLIGSPGLGYAKDRFSGEELETANAALYEEYKSEAVSKFLFFGEANGIDPQKLDALKKKEDATDEEKETLNTLTAASIEGDRRTLKADSFIPGAMAVIYLLILLYFKSIGGYRPVTVEGNAVARNDADDSGGDDSGQKTD
jgi:MFS family permease